MDGMKAPVCGAEILVVTTARFCRHHRSCQLVADHDGHHSAFLPNCEPPAELNWWTDE